MRIQQHKLASSTIFFLTLLHWSNAANFTRDFIITWGQDHAKTLNLGRRIQLSLNQTYGSAFASNAKHLFGKIDMQIKLVPNNSAGTVTAYYLSSDISSTGVDDHDELDFEFLGNVTGQPYILQTNVYANGVGGREQRIYLWFDPSVEFHVYSVLWNEAQIIFFVDGIPIRFFPNIEAQGIPYINRKPMGIFSSLWNGDTWATQGGAVKIDWTQAPFICLYTGYKADSCRWKGKPSTSCVARKWWNQPVYHVLDSNQAGKLKWVQQNWMVYDYCTDAKRYPVPPPECSSKLMASDLH